MSFFVDEGISSKIFGVFVYTPGPRLMQIHLVQNSTSARFGKIPQILT